MDALAGDERITGLAGADGRYGGADVLPIGNHSPEYDCRQSAISAPAGGHRLMLSQDCADVVGCPRRCQRTGLATGPQL
mgnify:CR=1 FL=1